DAGSADELAAGLDDPSDGAPGLFGVEGFNDFGYNATRFIPRSNPTRRTTTRPRSGVTTPSTPSTPAAPAPGSPSPGPTTPVTPPPGPGPGPRPRPTPAPPKLAFTA